MHKYYLYVYKFRIYYTADWRVKDKNAFEFGFQTKINKFTAFNKKKWMKNLIQIRLTQSIVINWYIHKSTYF